MRTDGQTTIHDEASDRFSQFCESALKTRYIIHVLNLSAIKITLNEFKGPVRTAQ
jgi:hypothetical protein